MKRQRLYRITIGLPYSNEVVIIQSPLTATINIIKKPGGLASDCNISIMGLSRDTRNKVFKDVMATDVYMPILVEAGYDNNLSLLFTGNIIWAYSERETPTIATRIQAYDGGNDIVNTRSSITLSKDNSIGDIIALLAKDFRHIVSGETGSLAYAGNRYRGCTLNGNTFYLLNKYTSNHSIVDNGKLYNLADNEVIEGYVPLISSNSIGLLGTPKLQNNLIEIDMLFEPRMVLQQIVQVESEVLPVYNGQYKITGITHNVVISEVECGMAKTTITCVQPNQVRTPGQGFNLVKNNIITPTNNLNNPIDSDVSDVYNYILKNGHPPSWRITTQISWNEMLTSFRINNDFHSSSEMPTLQQLANVKNTAQTLQGLVNTYFSGHNINISSGWRSKIGAYHISGQAVDFTISGISNLQVQQTFSQTYNGGLGYAPLHVHLDTRGYKYVFKDSDN